MVKNRLKLQETLEQIMASQDLPENRVFFQPPENVRLEYPCIIYIRTQVATSHADNAPYRRTKRYQVTVIDRDPDSPLPDLVGGLPGAAFVTHFANDNLNHDIYNVNTQSF